MTKMPVYARKRDPASPSTMHIVNGNDIAVKPHDGVPFRKSKLEKIGGGAIPKVPSKGAQPPSLLAGYLYTPLRILAPNVFRSFARAFTNLIPQRRHTELVPFF